MQSKSGSQSEKQVFIDEGKGTAWDVQTVGVIEMHHFKTFILKQGQGKKSSANVLGCTLGGAGRIKKYEEEKHIPPTG